MSLHSWLQNLRSTLTPGRAQRDRRRRGSLRAATHRPNLEALEDRLTPSFLWDGSYPEAPPGVEWGPSPLLADFTSDGVLDEIDIGTEWGVFEMVVRPGRGDGTFGDPIASYAPNAGYFAVADFNFDGRLDVFTAAPGNLWWDPDTPALGDTLLGRGDGTFDVWSTQPLFGVVVPTGVGTVNRNVVVAGISDFDLWLVNPDNTDAFVYLRNDGIWPNTPQLGIDDASVTEGNTGVVEAVFTVTLANGPDQPVTVQYATADGGATAGSDYQAASGTLTFAPGETSKTITVLVNGDRLVEPTEGFAVILSDPTNANIVDAHGQGTILDDEPRISITDATIIEGNTGTRSATFAVTLSSISEVDVTVHYDTADFDAVAGSDYVGASGDVVIPAGQTSATFTVAVMGDRLPEPTETFAVNLIAAMNATIGDGQGVASILDNEPRISISDATKREGRNGKTTLLTFTVKLSAAYDQPVTMSFRTVDGTATTGDSDYVARTGTLTFAPGETSKTITIEVKGDSKRELTEYFYLDLSNNSSNSWFSKNRGIGTILNDD